MIESTHLDPKTFAELVVQSQPSKESNPERIVKDKLTLYLVAQMVAERFNGMETDLISNQPSNFDQLLTRIDKLKIFDLDRRS